MFLETPLAFLRRGRRAALPPWSPGTTLITAISLGGSMLRAAAWTGILFAAGTGICLLFPGPLVEPIVLLALGTLLFLLSRRKRAAARDGAASGDPAVRPATTRAAR